MSLTVAVLIKQVPEFEAIDLGPDGRLVREGMALEMNPYCRRAVSKGVDLAAKARGRCVVITVGPPSAEDVLREAVAWGADEGVIVTDPALAGADTLITARALAAALAVLGPFDLVLAGRNSVDADTGQVPPELAELMRMPLIAGARELEVAEGLAQAHCEDDGGWSKVEVRLPAVVSCAERLCAPCKTPPDQRQAVSPSRIRTLTCRDLGPGPWAASSPTQVGPVRVVSRSRRGLRLTGPVEQQAALAVIELQRCGGLAPARERQCVASMVPRSAANTGRPRPLIGVVIESERSPATRELLGEAAILAQEVDGDVAAIFAAQACELDALGSWGADRIVLVDGSTMRADIAHAIAQWCDHNQPWALLAPANLWGREVSGRIAARLGAGLTGDAVECTVDAGQLVAWKPAFGGAMLAGITASSVPQMVTMRPVGQLLRPRAVGDPPPLSAIKALAFDRVAVLASGCDDTFGVLSRARAIVAVGQGVERSAYPELDPLLQQLGAELAATRKVTDKGWLPRSRQVGITGWSVSPDLYVAVGLSGKFNHTVGIRGAGTVLAINTDPSAPIFDHSDVGMVARWEDAVPALLRQMHTALTNDGRSPSEVAR